MAQRLPDESPPDWRENYYPPGSYPPQVTVPSTEAVEIRQAVRADLLAVFRIEQASFPQPWPFSAFERFLGRPGFMVAESVADSVDVVGYVVADSIPNSGRPIGHVKDIAVAPEARGEGIGKRLLERALAVLQAQDTQRVKLEVRATNDRALGLYRDFGFTNVRTVPRYYENGEDALVLVRSLDGP